MSLLLLFNQPASVAPYLSDTFTGTNGDPWDSSKWTMYGGTQTIQGNRGAMLTPGSYGSSFIEVDPVIPANFSFTGQVQFPSTDSTLAIEYRNNGTDYYRAYITPSELTIYTTPWPTIVATNSISTSLTDLVNFRLEVDGTSHKLRFWLNSDPEPSTWNINTTNSVTTATPTVPMRLFFGDPNSVTGYLDNVSITSVGGVPPPTGTGAPSLAGVSSSGAGQSGSQVSGSGTANLDGVGSGTGTGAVTAIGSSSSALASIVSSGAGNAAAIGSGAPALTGTTSSGSGSHTAGVAGSGSPSLSGATSSGPGSLTASGSSSGTLSGVTSSGFGSLTASGSSSGTLSGATSSGSGFVGISGSSARTLSSLASSGSGSHTAGVAGSGSPSLSGVTSSGFGSLTASGSSSGTLSGATSSGSGFVGISGSSARTLSSLTQSGSGSLSTAGSSARTLASLTSSGSGSVIGGSFISGALASSLAGVYSVGTGFIVVRDDVLTTEIEQVLVLYCTASGDMTIETTAVLA